MARDRQEIRRALLRGLAGTALGLAGAAAVSQINGARSVFAQEDPAEAPPIKREAPVLPPVVKREAPVLEGRPAPAPIAPEPAVQAAPAYSQGRVIDLVPMVAVDGGTIVIKGFPRRVGAEDMARIGINRGVEDLHGVPGLGLVINLTADAITNTHFKNVDTSTGADRFQIGDGPDNGLAVDTLVRPTNTVKGDVKFVRLEWVQAADRTGFISRPPKGWDEVHAVTMGTDTAQFAGVIEYAPSSDANKGKEEVKGVFHTIGDPGRATSVDRYDWRVGEHAAQSEEVLRLSNLKALLATAYRGGIDVVRWPMISLGTGRWIVAKSEGLLSLPHPGKNYENWGPEKDQELLDRGLIRVIDTNYGPLRERLG